MSFVAFPAQGPKDVAQLQTLLHRYRAALERIDDLFCARGEMLLAASALGIRRAEMAEWCGLSTPTVTVALHRLRQQGVETRALRNPEAELRAVTEELHAAQREAVELRQELHAVLERLLGEGWNLTMLTVATGVPERTLAKYRKPYVARRPPFGSGRGYGPE